jgi:hypothetical protein
MLADTYMPDDDVCPIGDELLGELYSASKVGLPTLVATVPPRIRAMLALFCYHRSHLHSMGLAVAATCDEDDLVQVGGRVGKPVPALARGAAAATARLTPRPPAKDHAGERHLAQYDAHRRRAGRRRRLEWPDRAADQEFTRMKYFFIALIVLTPAGARAAAAPVIGPHTAMPSPLGG